MKFNPTSSDIGLKPKIDFEAIKEGQEVREKIRAGGTDALLDGLTINTGDKVNALFGESGDYEVMLSRGQVEIGKFAVTQLGDRRAINLQLCRLS